MKLIESEKSRLYDWAKDGSIMTFTGIRFNPFKPDLEKIDIRDIAHALSLINRFNGHTIKPYSVAQHSVDVSYLCPEHPLEGLMHDATEAYMGDMASPIKAHYPQFKKDEDNLMAAIFEKYGLKFPLPKEVKKADRKALELEFESLMNVKGLSEHYMFNGLVLSNYNPLSPDQAELMFYRRFAELTM